MEGHMINTTLFVIIEPEGQISTLGPKGEPQVGEDGGSAGVYVRQVAHAGGDAVAHVKEELSGLDGFIKLSQGVCVMGVEATDAIIGYLIGFCGFSYTQTKNTFN